MLKSTQLFVVTPLVPTIFAQHSAEDVAARLARPQAIRRLPPRCVNDAPGGRSRHRCVSDLPRGALPTDLIQQTRTRDSTAKTRRRSDVAGIFHNRKSVVRLVDSVLSEQDDGWQVSRRYTSVESIEKAMRPVLTVQDGPGRVEAPALMAA